MVLATHARKTFKAIATVTTVSPFSMHPLIVLLAIYIAIMKSKQTRVINILNLKRKYGSITYIKSKETS